MATLVRIDDLIINLDNVTRIEVFAATEDVDVHFIGDEPQHPLMLHGKQGARLLRWLDAGGRVSVA